MPKVNFIRPEVAKCLPKWKKVDHCLGGEDADDAREKIGQQGPTLDLSPGGEPEE